MLGPNIMLTVGSSTVIDGQRLWFGQVGYGLPDLGVLDAREGHDVAGADLLDLDALKPEVREGLDHARPRHRAVFVDQVARTRRA